MPKYIIDGRQLLCGASGVQRYLSEVLRELDGMIEKDEFTVVVPARAQNVPQYKNLKVVRFGVLNGLLWENISLPLYLAAHKAKGVFLCTVVPFLYPFGIVTIHDVLMFRYKALRKSFGFFDRFLLKRNYWFAVKGSSKILTVSISSKNDICSFFNVPEEKVLVLGNAWQHMERVQSDDSVFSGYTKIRRGEYYMALSANRWQKNFKWIIDVAKRNPRRVFVIVGGHDGNQNFETVDAENVLFVGSLPDGQVKALYQNCKAFLFPSICEGFGIPPLEALSCGAPIVISKTSCLPEIYGPSAVYIDPFDSDIDLDSLILENKPSESYVKKTLQKYSWKKTASGLLGLMRGREITEE